MILKHLRSATLWILLFIPALPAAPPPEAPLLWLRAWDLTHQADGTPVRQWTDAARKAGDAIPVSDASAPVKTSDPRTGKTLVLFDGVRNALGLPALKVPYEFALFIACTLEDQLDGDSAFRPLLSSAADPFRKEGANGYGFTFTKPGQESIGVCLHSGKELERTSLALLPTGRLELFCFRKEGATLRLYRGGALVAEDTLERPPQSELATGYRLGGGAQRSRFFKGALAELVLFEGRLDDAFFDRWTKQLLERHGIRAHRVPLGDPRYFGGGKLLAKAGYYDQPYLAALPGGEWVCLVTRSGEREGAADQHLALLRSSDRGRTWSAPEATLEPEPPAGQPGLRPSWVCPWVAPDGRLFAFYNVDRAGKKPAVEYRYRVSTNAGRAWSGPVELPLRATPMNQDFPRLSSWGVSPPFLQGSNLLFSFTRFDATPQRYGEGWIIRSPNAARETEAARIRWEMLPEGERGIRGDGMGNVQEEHILVPLVDGRLFCVFRTSIGVMGQTFSADGGRHFEPPTLMLGLDGRPIKQPRACPRLFQDRAGRVYLWTHEHDGRAFTIRNKNRDTVWLRAAHFEKGGCAWGSPELLLYDFNPPFGSGMSYPDWIFDGPRVVLTTTQKKELRQFEFEDSFLTRLREEAIAPAADFTWSRGDVSRISGMAPLSAAGFTLGLALSSGAPQGAWLHVSNAAGAFLSISREGDGLVLAFGDGAGTPVRALFDATLLGRGLCATFIVDLRARLALAVLDGKLDDGGKSRSCGAVRLPADLDAPLDRTSVVGRWEAGPIERLKIWARPLMIAEAQAAQGLR